MFEPILAAEFSYLAEIHVLVQVRLQHFSSSSGEFTISELANNTSLDLSASDCDVVLSLSAALVIASLIIAKISSLDRPFVFEDLAFWDLIEFGEFWSGV
jgi:hypothetical protein